MGDLTHLSLFSGIGGLDLAAEWAGFRTVGQCEWADYPRAVLEKHWPGMPRWRDIRTLTGDSFYEQTGRRTVTVVSGGFPCQPFSTAGKRRGKEDDRYLWPEMLRVIQEIRPAWVVGENVAGIVSMALDTVLSNLESLGYACQAVIIPAAGVDARHRRYRVAIMGYAEYDGFSAANKLRSNEKAGDKRRSKEQAPPWKLTGASESVDVRSVQRSQHGSEWDDAPNADIEIVEDRMRFSNTAGRQRFTNDGWWPAEPDVGRVAHGVPARVDRLKCLGNAVVPQQFYPIFKAIAEIEKQMENQ